MFHFSLTSVEVTCILLLIAGFRRVSALPRAVPLVVPQAVAIRCDESTPGERRGTL